MDAMDYVPRYSARFVRGILTHVLDATAPTLGGTPLNKILHYKMTIEFDIWECKKQHTLAEMDSLMLDLKQGKILGSAGNVKTLIRGSDDITS